MAQCTQTRPWYNVILCTLCSRFYHKTVVVSNSFTSYNVLAQLFVIKFETVLAQGWANFCLALCQPISVFELCT